MAGSHHCTGLWAPAGSNDSFGSRVGRESRLTVWTRASRIPSGRSFLSKTGVLMTPSYRCAVRIKRGKARKASDLANAQ